MPPGEPSEPLRGQLFAAAAESSANVDVHAASGYRGVYPNKSRWPPLTTVSTEPGLPAGSHDLP